MIVDLTMPLSTSTPVYPGDPKVEVAIAADLKKDGYLDHSVKLGTHNGTHVDAPGHMIKGAKLLKDFSVENFVGSGKVIDARKSFSLEDADIQEGDIVLFATGRSDNYAAADYYTEYPAVPEDIAQQLVDKKVKMVGVDTGSVDYDPFPAHKLLLGNNILIIENLVKLSGLIGKQCRIYALPIKLEVEGSPARVIAEL